MSSISPGYIALVSKLSRLPYLTRFARSQIERQRFCANCFLKVVLVSCLPPCHNSSNLFARSVCPHGFDLAPKPFSDLQVGSVNACRLTMRAPDKWDAPRFSSRFVASSFFRLRALSPLRPLAGNASRWAAMEEVDLGKVYMRNSWRIKQRG
jgi:hypothetical protein